MDTPLPPKITSYLHKYADMDRIIIYPGIKKRYNNIVVIPAINEFENLKTLISSLNGLDDKYSKESLFLFVINNTISAPEEIRENNKKALEYLNNLNIGIDIYVIDAATTGNEMPDKTGGVGLARKTGMDYALTLFDYESSRKRILICLDADCTVSQNYLTEIVDEFNSKNMQAASIRFEHDLNSDNLEAIICYEIFLRYYVAALKYSGSYYAFHTVGSSMACDVENYIKIEGMNKRKAAEDFYFLEKLSKNCEISSIRNARVYPSPRSSLRVPFGTGQRVSRYYQDVQDEYVLYPFECFRILKKWLDFFNSGDIKPAEEYLKTAGNIHIELYNFLIEQSFKDAWEKIIEHSGHTGQIQKQKLFWFDGFRTLKLIHYLRDHLQENNNMFSVVSELFRELEIPHAEYTGGTPGINFQIEYLNILKQID